MYFPNILTHLIKEKKIYDHDKPNIFFFHNLFDYLIEKEITWVHYLYMFYYILLYLIVTFY